MSMHCFIIVVFNTVPCASEYMHTYPHINIKFISNTVPVVGLNVGLNKCT